MKIISKILLPVILLFVIINIILATTGSFFQQKNIDTTVLYFANMLFLILALLVFLIQKNALKNSNPNVFIRSVIGGTMIKMFATVIAVLSYVLLTGKDYNTKAVFISLFMYLIYLGVEVYAISKLNKTKNA